MVQILAPFFGSLRGSPLLKYLLSALLLTASVSLSAVQAVEIKHPKAVVELFTSQGCSSCPPADKIMGKFTKDDDILGLSWHVDYWDYLGWKDSFASAANTERQYRYGQALKQRSVYTPQAIINGRAHVVGAYEGKIRDKIAFFEQDGRGMTIPINTVFSDDRLKISVPDTDVSRKATLWLVYFNKQETVSIEEGENAGKEIVYHNVVHDTQAIGMVQTGGLKIEFPVSEMERHDYESCVFILQIVDAAGNPGPIIGATVLSGL